MLPPTPRPVITASDSCRKRGQAAGLQTSCKNVVVVLRENDSITTADALHIVAIEDLPASRRRK